MNPPPVTHDTIRLLAEREWLERLAARLVGVGPDADDLAQEAFVKAMQVEPPLAEQGSLRAWLATVTRRLAGRRRRSDALRRAREASRPAPDGAPSASAALERAAVRRAVMDEVMALPEPLRSAVVLRYFEGLDYADVAARQRISPIAARKRVSRGIDRLRASFDAQSGGDRASWLAALVPFVEGARSSALGKTGVLVMQAKSKVVLGACAVLASVAGWRALDARSSSDGTALSGGLSETRDAIPAEGAVAPLDAQGEGRTAAAAEPAEIAATEARAAFPARPAGEVGTLVIRASWASDGSPAADIGVKVMPWKDADAFLHQRMVRTDASGTAIVDQLCPGRVGVYPDRCGGGSVEVLAARTSTYELALEDGVTVTGRVVDGAGSPVGGAWVELSEHGNSTEGASAATSDAAGRYSLRGIRGQRMISARAGGFAPSQQTMIEAAEGTAIELDLTLRGAGGSLGGVVLDADGVPLEGARVRISPGESVAADPDDGRWIDSQPLPVEVRSDRDGRFRALGLAPVVHALEVRTAEHAPHRGSVAIPAAGHAEVEVTLARGGVLEGTVRRQDGAPAVGGRVLAGSYGRFDSHMATVGPDGRFRIVGLSPGVVEPRASEDGHGSASTSLTLADGETVHWDATLASGASSRGVVVDEHGAPVAGWVVSACNEDVSLLTYRSATTDADGAFTLTDIPPRVTGLAVGPPDFFTIGTALRLSRVLPSSEPLRVVIPRDRMPISRVTCVVRDSSGTVSPETELHLTRPETGAWRSLHPDASGRFEVERVYPGPLDVRLECPGRAPIEGRFDVPVAGTLDLGEWTLYAGGRLALTLRAPGAGGPSGYVSIEVLDESGRVLESSAGRVGANELGPYRPGLLRLCVSGESVAALELEVSIEDGETVSRELDLRPGTSRRIGVIVDGAPLEPDPQAIARCEVKLVGPDGRASRTFESFLSGAFTVSGLERGSYTVEVIDRYGRRGATELVVGDLAPPDPSGPPAATLTLE